VIRRPGAGGVRTVLLTLGVVAACGGRWTSVADGVVRDRQTGLEWTSPDLDPSLTWEDADRACHELRLGGRDGWRLPEIGELKALYEKRLDTPCGDAVCHVDSAIRLRGRWIWSATTPYPAARFYFDFSAGNQLAPNLSPQLVRRVVCVRSPV